MAKLRTTQTAGRAGNWPGQEDPYGDDPWGYDFPTQNVNAGGQPQVNPNMGLPDMPHPTDPIVPTEGPGAPTLPGVGSIRPTFGGNRNDAGWMNSAISYWGGMAGADPSLKNDPGYWIKRMNETGGLGDDNFDYWQWMALNNYKQPPHGQQGGIGAGLNMGQNQYGPEAWNSIMSVLKQGWDADPKRLALRMENAREGIDRGRKSQMNNLTAQLAERGLMGSGAEATGLGRIESDLAGQYSGALRDLTLDEDKLSSDRYLSALGQAVNMTQGENTRQLGLGQLALQQLSENRQWNQFLANFGLDREKFQHDVESGNIGQYLEIIKLFLGAGQGTSGGYQ